jgi:hypothetical protein
MDSDVAGSSNPGPEEGEARHRAGRDPEHGTEDPGPDGVVPGEGSSNPGPAEGQRPKGGGLGSENPGPEE